MDDGSLAALVGRCKRKEHGAFDELLAHLLPGIFRTLCGLTRDPSAAEDLAQEVAEKLFLGIDRFREGTRFRAWVATVTLNHYRDWRRRNRPYAPTDAEAAAVEDDQANRVHREEASRQLWQAILQLREEERTVVCLRHLAEMTFAEIAKCVGRPLGTVLSLQHRALERLGRMLKAQTSAKRG